MLKKTHKKIVEINPQSERVSLHAKLLEEICADLIKKLEKKSSTLDNVNVRILIAKIKDALHDTLWSYLFEPNDELTRSSIELALNHYLNTLPVDDYAVVCEPNDENSLHIDVAFKPKKAAEFIYINAETNIT